jgi:cell division protein FtsQ
VLEAPEPNRAPESPVPRRVSASPNRKLRRDFSEDFADDFSDSDDDDISVPRRQRKPGLRLRLRGSLPSTKWGRIVAGVVLLICLGACGAGLLVARNALLHDQRFVIPSSSSVEIQGNAHVTRAQLLSVFGEDVERSVFNVPLAERRVELERLPWVAHATVMRLLPNRLRVSIVERTPVAFVRQGNHIGLVDAGGVLLDMPLDSQKVNTHYSFPVVTGITADEPLSTRAARMKIFERFTADLDGSGEKISEQLSEVDLSNPEDVKALIPDHSSEVLVHFGEENFLDRYRKFEAHLAEWRTQYPKLASVDMRYEREVVLEMQAGTAVPVAGATGEAGGSAPAVNAPETTAAKVAAASSEFVNAKTVAKAATVAKTTPAHGAKAHAVPVRHASAARAKVSAKAPAHFVAQNYVAFDAPGKHSTAKAKPHTKAAAKHHTAVVRPSGRAPQYHPPKVIHP